MAWRIPDEEVRGARREVLLAQPVAPVEQLGFRRGSKRHERPAHRLEQRDGPPLHLLPGKVRELEVHIAPLVEAARAAIHVRCKEGAAEA